MRAYHLIAHSGIQGAGVALITGNVWLGLTGWLAHTIIDEAKVRGRTTFAQDHALHIAARRCGSVTCYGRRAIEWAIYLALVALAANVVAAMIEDIERIMLLVLCVIAIAALVWEFG